MKLRTRSIEQHNIIDFDHVGGVVGSRIREQRVGAGATLAELAEKTGISIPMLSKIENAKVSPAISVYARIASALGMTLGELFDSAEEGDDSISVVHEAEHLVVAQEPYTARSLAFRKKKKKMEPFLFEYPVKMKNHQPYTHNSEEFIFVISGRIEFKYGQKKVILNSGDCVYYDGRIPHSGRPLDNQTATALVVESDELHQ